MASSDSRAFNIGHPAPHRGQIGLGWLMTALMAAPIAWSIQLLVIYGVASSACGPDRPQGAGARDLGALVWLLPAVNVAALIAAALAIGLSFSHLRRTRSEHADQAGGMMDAGEGRTRFLSIWAVWTSVLFLLAIAFNTVSAFWTGLCSA